MDSLTRATPPKDEISSLRTFYDSYESNIRGLEALDVKTDTYGCLLIPILLKKLPESIRYAIFRSDLTSYESHFDEKSKQSRRVASQPRTATKPTTKNHLFRQRERCYPERSQERRARNNARKKRNAPTVTVTIGQTIAANS